MKKNKIDKIKEPGKSCTVSATAIKIRPVPAGESPSMLVSKKVTKHHNGQTLSDYLGSNILDVAFDFNMMVKNGTY